MTFTITVLALAWVFGFGAHHSDLGARCQSFPHAFGLRQKWRAAPPFWRPGAHAARRPYLVARGRIAAALRAWFAAGDFIEVETGALQVSPGNETHLHAFATELIAPGRRAASALSAHLAGICLQEAAGRRRDAHLRFCPRVPQSRARRPASSGIHAARMVPGERALRDAVGGLRRAAGGGGAGSGPQAIRRFAAAAPILSPRRSGSPSPRPSRATPVSMSWQL